MITRLAIEERVREWGLREDVVEKDYVLGWVLWGIGVDQTLSETWVFKGGTCLKKCYLETYRFSEDLDFTILPGGPVQAAELTPILERVLTRVTSESGIDFSQRPPLLREHAPGQYTQGRIYFRGPRQTPHVASIILDLSASEQIVQPTVLRPIRHSYPDLLPEPATVRCYSFEEVFAEKIRAMAQRGRPRDLFDIVNLFRRPDLSRYPVLIRQVLARKCEARGVALPTGETIIGSPFRAELESEWANMLAHQLPALPPFRDFWEEIPRLFAWLNGSSAAEPLPPMPTAAEEEETWVPPSTAWTWGEGVPLETVRYAAANHLCIELGYDGESRTVEPYSLRRTRAGKLLLHGVKADTGEARTYRVDRMQSVQVTGRVFKPKYQIEFTSSGPINTPPTSRSTYAPRNPRHTPRWIYTVRCPACQREFRWVTRDLTLGTHQNESKQRCSGSGRRGILVKRHFE